MFDANGYYRGCVPCSLGATVVHVICIQTWNKVYRSVATRLTDRENHRTEEVIPRKIILALAFLLGGRKGFCSVMRGVPGGRGRVEVELEW